MTGTKKLIIQQTGHHTKTPYMNSHFTKNDNAKTHTQLPSYRKTQFNTTTNMPLLWNKIIIHNLPSVPRSPHVLSKEKQKNCSNKYNMIFQKQAFLPKQENSSFIVFHYFITTRALQPTIYQTNIIFHKIINRDWLAKFFSEPH